MPLEDRLKARRLIYLGEEKVETGRGILGGLPVSERYLSRRQSGFMLCCSTGLNLEQLGSNKFNLGRIFLIIRVDPNTGSRSKGSQEGPWGSEKEQEKGHTQSTAHFLHFTDQLF